MKITFEKTESVETMVQALSEFLLKENKDYSKLKSSASLYVNLVDEQGNPHPDNASIYIYKDGKIVDELSGLTEKETTRAKTEWSNYIQRINKKNSAYLLVQELKIQEPQVHVSSLQENNKIKYVHVYLQFQDSRRNSWWFYGGTLHQTCPISEHYFDIK